MSSEASAYPIRVRGDLDPALSRWQWIVKWLLAIPHYVCLIILYIAWFVVTVVAFFAILFTGRYPRGLFDFGVGVLRWGWRVRFYALSALGTDRYPPFRLAADDNYPADLHADYPERLNRWMVLIKWWLLAIPQYLIVAALVGGAPMWGRMGRGHHGHHHYGGGGMFSLLAVLLVVAVVGLLFTGRYPGGLFNLVIGVNRWAIRVRAYAMLLTDEYPPFRLDQGPREAEPVASAGPVAPPEPPVPPASPGPAESV
jgi:hypothetical protein